MAVFLIGLWIGGSLGILLASLLRAARDEIVD